MRRRQDRGFVLVLITSVMALLMVLTLIALNVTTQNVRGARQQYSKAQTLYQAEAGANLGVREVLRGFRDKKSERYVAFDPLEPQKVFRLYVDDAAQGLRRYLKEGEQRQGGEDLLQGEGTIDYKVYLTGIDDLEKVHYGGPGERLGERFGRAVEVESKASEPRGATSQVSRRVILSYLPNIIFKYGMLTNRLKECQFCHMRIHGDLGQVGDVEFGPISPHVTKGWVEGNIYLTGAYHLNRHPAHKQLVRIGGKIFENTQDSRKLPTQWPTILEQNERGEPTIAGFYLDLVERADLKGISRLQGGEILAQVEEPDRFRKLKEIRGVYKGNLILRGTTEQPLKIEGPLVVKGDLIIEGVVSGYGSIYVERNIYIIGDIRYQTSPVGDEWRDIDAAERARRSQAKYGPDFRFDRLGLFAGGNVILGNITSPELLRYSEYFLNYESSGMLHGGDPHGFYVLDGKSGTRTSTLQYLRYVDKFEDGSDYDHDGKRAWGEGMRTVIREKETLKTTGLLPKGSGFKDFVGGWISRATFNEFALRGAKNPREKINRVANIDATIYTDGAFTGYKPSNDRGKSEESEYLTTGDIDGDGLTFHGAVIARDVDVLAPGGWYVYYDNRNYVGQGSSLNFEPSRVIEVTGWRER